MKRLVQIFLVLMVLTSNTACVPLFGATQGGISPVDFYHTLSGMRAAMRGDVGTAIWQSEQLLVYMWQQGSGYAFAVVSKAGEPREVLAAMGNGNGMSVKTAADFIFQLEKNGFAKITPNDVPLTWTQFLLSYCAAVITSGSRSLITPLIIPLAPMIDVNRVEET